MPDVVLTKKEQQAIAELEKLAKKWPQSLELFSWSGSLHVFKKDANGVDSVWIAMLAASLVSQMMAAILMM
ncbi:hypothetical protein ACNPKZ_20165 [Shewanella algae]|uniref:hypothetical protein n=1 Tax=Shewanella algae TaxID=38313 RepID=UPI000B346B4B|nr:hypothetical protein KVP08_022690 [Shewanella putrefaciens]